jgi:hypothetical protein
MSIRCKLFLHNDEILAGFPGPVTRGHLRCKRCGKERYILGCGGKAVYLRWDEKARILFRDLYGYVA